MDSLNYHNMSDEELVELCKSYDDLALQTLIKKMESVIAGCVSSFSDNRFENEDLHVEPDSNSAFKFFKPDPIVIEKL